MSKSNSIGTDSAAPLLHADADSSSEIPGRGRDRIVTLPSAQWELIELCVRVSQVLGVPRSVGEIFGFVFSSPAPVTFDDIVKALAISNGSASQGLRYLRRLGAIKVSFYARDRRDYFQAETSLQKLVNGYLTETVLYKLGGMAERLHALRIHLAESEDPKAAMMSERVSLLLNWNSSAGSAVTAALRVLA